MRLAIRDILVPAVGRKPRQGLKGVGELPAPDKWALKMIARLQNAVGRHLSRGQGFWPGAVLSGVVLGWALERPLRQADGTAQSSEGAWADARFRELIARHPARAALKRAARLRVINALVGGGFGDPSQHYLGEEPDFPRCCRVAAARMLSVINRPEFGRRLWMTRRSPVGQGVVLERVDGPPFQIF